MQEMTEISGQMLSLCDAAEEVMDDESVAAPERLEAWKAALEEEEVTHAEVLSIVDVVAKGSPAEGYAAAVVIAKDLTSNADWACEPLQALLGVEGDDIDDEAVDATG